MPKSMLKTIGSKAARGVRKQMTSVVLGALTLGAGLGVPQISHAHTVNICWLVLPNGDVKFYSGTYHTPDGNLSGGLTIDGTRYNFTEVFTGSIDTVGVTNCQGGFNGDGTVVADPCSSGIPVQQWQTVVVSGLADNTYSLSITADSDVESPWSGCYPAAADVNVTDPCAAFGDDDNDFICNPSDQCDADPTKGVPGSCGCGAPETDTDSDGTADCVDGCPNDAAKTVAGVCGCGVTESSTDSDSDGTADCVDACPNDNSKTAAGVCGCGVPDTDSDSDGTFDCADGCPNDNAKTAAGVCGCGVTESSTDSDSDGKPDCIDACPNDGNKVDPGICGCGVSDVDSDSDGIEDCNDLCLGSNATGDDDHDGLCGDRDHRALVTTTDFTGIQGPCTEGGSIIKVGSDENGDAVLADSEVSHTSYVCDGITGTDGLTSLVASSQITPGSTCPTGGFEIRFGVDDDRNGTLSGAEQDGSQVICSGLNSAIRVTPIAAGDATCGAGGVSIASGTDDDGDGVLDDPEVDSSEKVCSGQNSLISTTALSPGGTPCPSGGTQIDVGTDVNGNGKLDAQEIASTQVLCNGADGASAPHLAVRTSSLPAGDKSCPAGGTKVETGIDTNGNGKLDDNEAQSSDTVCEPAGLLFDTATLADDAEACPHGGQRVRIGHDDGTPSGTAGDGALQDGEVESTRDVCLAPTDVLVSGGASSCTVHVAHRGPTTLLWSGLLLTFGMIVRRRRRARPDQASTPR